MKEGIQPLSHDERDLHLGEIINLPKTVPDFFIDGGFANNHVQEEDDCSAFAVALARELREKIELDREFQFASMKDLVGDPQSFGGNLRDALSVPVKIGVLPLSLRPIACLGKPLSYLRFIANWGKLDLILPIAWEHRAKSYVFVNPTQGMDAFDSIASHMWYWLQKDEKRAIVFGTLWDWSLTDYIIEKWTGNGSGHAMAYRGKLTVNGVPYLIVQQNYGPNAGKNGLHLFSRDIVNKSQNVYGAGMFTSYTPDELRTMMQNGYKIDGDVAMSTIRALMKFIADLLSLLRKKTSGMVGGISPEPVGCTGTMLWDTKDHIRRNVRVICDEYGIPPSMKNIICACIMQESGWKPKIISDRNRDGSRDWGLVQVNDNPKYWIGNGKYFASTDEVLNNPEKSVRFMLTLAKQGHLNYWMSYTSGAYKRWLKEESLPSTPY